MSWERDETDAASRRTFLERGPMGFQRFDAERWIQTVCRAVEHRVEEQYQKRVDANYFLAPDLEFLLDEVFRIPYPTLLARGLIPFKPVTDGMAIIRYRSLDMTGQAKWIGSEAGDIPIADVSKSEKTIALDTIAMQFGYTIDELAAAAAANEPLDRDRAIACRTLIERGIDEALCVGQANRGIYGLLNQDLYSADAAELITLTTGTWVSTTSLLIHADIAQMVKKIYTDTKGTSEATHMGFPTTVWNHIRVTPWGTDNNSRTILMVLKENFPFLTFFHWPRLDTADVAGTGGRVILFSQGPLNFFAGECRGFTPEAPQARGLRFEIPCHARLTPGIAVPNALCIKYADNAQ